jgi:hypothetical protein
MIGLKIWGENLHGIPVFTGHSGECFMVMNPDGLFRSKKSL